MVFCRFFEDEQTSDIPPDIPISRVFHRPDTYPIFEIPYFYQMVLVTGLRRTEALDQVFAGGIL
jgi:hypothetical protein